MEENHSNTKNASDRVHFLYLVGVLRKGGGGGTAGEKGVYISMYYI